MKLTQHEALILAAIAEHGKYGFVDSISNGSDQFVDNVITVNKLQRRLVKYGYKKK